MNRVERAIIMAAGFGSRMSPVTLTTPKPLVKVNGVRMIDTVIRALHKQGIYEIYVVVGYKKEQFESLTQEYEGVTLIENPYYNTCNNISSLYMARQHLENVMIMDGDQVIYNEQVLEREFERSGYNVVWTDGYSNEWLFTVEDGIVKSCRRNGGVRGWQMFSVSRWSKEDGLKLKKYLELEFENNKNYQIFWDDIAIFCHPEDFQLGIRSMQQSDVIEIDSLAELAAIDPSYKRYLDYENNTNSD